MPVVKNLMVRAGADFSAITKQAQRAQKSMQTMQQRVNRSCGLMQTAMNGLKRVMGALGVGLTVSAIISAGKDAKEAYDKQAEAEAKLAQVMRNTMGARAEDVASIKALTSAQQELGVVGDEVQLAGAQEMATYLSQRESLEKLIPVMNDMIAQQYGYNATTESAVNIATMMGKVMDGQTGALRRYGYTFTDAQEAVLKYGNEAQRAATLAEVVSQSVGGMNQALASTKTGRIQQLKNTLGDIKERFGAAVTSILTTFLPTLQAVASVLADVATLANRVAQAIANVFGSSGSAQSAIIGYGGAAADTVGEISGATEEAAESAEKMATAGFDTLQKLSGGNSGSGSGAGSEDSSGGSGGISTIYEESQEAAETVGWLERGLQRIKEMVGSWDTSKLSESFEKLKQAAEPFVNLIGDGLAWAWENVLEPVGKWVVEDAGPASLDALTAATDCLRTAAEKLQPIWQWIWDYVISPIAAAAGDEITDTLRWVEQFFQDLEDVLNGAPLFEWHEPEWIVTIKTAWADTKESLKKRWAELTSGIEEKRAKIRAWWGNTKEGIRQRWQNLTSGIETKWAKIRAWWGNTKEGIRQRWQSLTSGIETKWAKIRAWWGDTKEGIRQRWQSLTSGVETKWATIRAWWADTKDSLRQKWGDLTAGIKEFLAPVRAKIATTWKDLKSDFESLISPAKKYVIHIAADIAVTLNSIKAWINTSIIDPINKALRDVEILGARPFWNVQIPRLAQGGYLRANNPTFAVVGDNRYQGEIVSPEDKLAAMAKEAASSAILGARMVMAGARDIRTPLDVPTVLRALTGPSGAFGLSVGGIGDAAMSLLRRILRAVEDGKVIAVDRRELGRITRQDISVYTKGSGAVTRAR